VVDRTVVVVVVIVGDDVVVLVVSSLAGSTFCRSINNDNNKIYLESRFSILRRTRASELLTFHFNFFVI